MYIMLKNIAIAKFDFNNMIFEQYRPELMPFGLRGKGVSLFTVQQWLSDRVLTLSRSNAKKIISAAHLDQNDRIGICYACNGLSLTDCYWIKNEESKLDWDKINLYNNSLNKGIAYVALTGKYATIQGKIHTPELTGDGSYAKCWRRYNGSIFLYKTGSLQGNNKEHLIEVLSSDILDTLHVNHVYYRLGKYYDKQVSICKNITNINKSICSMNYYAGYCNRNNINLTAWLQCQKEYYEMLIADYIIFNTDRHSNNWGIQFNADNGQLISLHSLFDHNISLGLDGDPYSKVIAGRTLEQCAKWAKKHTNISVIETMQFAKKAATKKRFVEIFNSLNEYNAFLDRIHTYNEW